MSAVIVAWNSGAALGSCLDSLRVSARRADIVLQLVIVDNASTDGASEALQLAALDVRIRNPANAGYGVAVAQGFARADAEWLLQVNPDLTLAPDFFENLLSAASSVETDVAVLVPELRYAADHETVNSRGIAVDDIGIPAEVDLGEHASEELLPREVLGGSSGCCLLRREAVVDVGGPEPVFFAYLEDVDLAIRLQRAGYRAILVPNAIAWHEGSASTGEGSPLKSFLVARNRRILFRLHGPGTIRARLWRLVTDVGHALVTSFDGDLAAPWLGRLDAIRLRRYTQFLRRARARHDMRMSSIPLTARVGFRSTLRRKRAARGLMHREP